MPNYLCTEAMNEYFEQGLKTVLAGNHYAPAKRRTWTPRVDDHEWETWQYTGPMVTTKPADRVRGQGPGAARTWHTFRHRNHPKYGRVYAYVRRETWGWDGWVKPQPQVPTEEARLYFRQPG